MFDLHLYIQGATSDIRNKKRLELEVALRQKFGDAIRDISPWGEEYSRNPNEVLVAVQFQHRDPHEVRRTVSALRYEVHSMQNLISMAFYPINREQKRRKPLKRTR